MPPKPTFVREDVLAAAVKVVKEHGWRDCSARTIAKELGSSTMPVYTALGSMEQLEKQVRAAAQNMIIDYQVREYTDNPFVNEAIGYVLFARDEPNLFRFLYVERGQPSSLEERREMQRVMLDRLQDSSAVQRVLTGISQEQLDQITVLSWIFVHGLAMLVNGGVLNLGEDDIRQYVEESGSRTAMWVLNAPRRS